MAGINQSLPVWQQSINNRTAAIQSALSAIHYAEEGHAKGEADMRTVLVCHEELYNQRRRFLEAVLQYNLDIAEYAVATAPAGTSHERLAAMLIPAKISERVSAVPGKSPAIFSGGGAAHSDGWVPSTLKSLEPETTPPTRTLQSNPAVTNPAVANPAVANPLGQPRDPFGTPAASDRNNDRSGGDRYNFGR